MQRPVDLASPRSSCALRTRRLRRAAWWRARRATVWRATTAVLTGALLGVLAGMRYDVTLGLPEGASALLQSLAFTATWTWMGSGSLAQGRASLHLEPDDLPATEPSPERPAQPLHTGRPSTASLRRR